MNRSYSKIRHIQEANLSIEKRRFNQLLESTMGNVKPLIMEREPNVVPVSGPPVKKNPPTTSVPKTPTPTTTNIPQQPKTGVPWNEKETIKVTLWGNPDGTDEKGNIDVDSNSLKLVNKNVQFDYKFAGTNFIYEGYFDCSTPNTVSVEYNDELVTYYLGKTRIPWFESMCARNQGYASVGNQNTNNQVSESDLTRMIRRVINEQKITQEVNGDWNRKKRRRISEQLEKVPSTNKEYIKRKICYQYKVQSGDNMWDIASKMRQKFEPNQSMDDYWINWTSNMTEFGIVDMDRIKTGDLIPIPMSCVSRISEQNVKGVTGIEAYTNMTNNIAKTKYNKLYNAVAGLGTDETTFLKTIQSILSKDEYDRINAIAKKAGEDIPTLFFGDFSDTESTNKFCTKLSSLKVTLPQKCENFLRINNRLIRDTGLGTQR